jgi:hypothetical protein
MRYIEKIPLPDDLQKSLEQALQDKLSWKEFSKDKIAVKQALREHLDAEQAGLCASPFKVIIYPNINDFIVFKKKPSCLVKF